MTTEPNVRLAVLFGSTSTGADRAESDVDVLVVLDNPSVSRLAELAERLSRRLGREIQLVRLHDAESSSVLMADVLEHGRVLVDRDRRWPELVAAAGRWQRMARRGQRSLTDSMESLDDARELAT